MACTTSRNRRGRRGVNIRGKRIMQVATKARWAVALLLGTAAVLWVAVDAYPDEVFSAYLEARRWLAAAGPMPTLPAPRLIPRDMFVVLDAGSAVWIPKDGTWKPSMADIYYVEASLRQVSTLKATNWPADSGIRIDHPERYFRQYVGVIWKGKKLIYVNALCNATFIGYWRETLVRIMDGGTCYWQAFYDPALGTFTALTINGVA